MSTKTIEDRIDEIIKKMLGMNPKAETPLESATIPASGKEPQPLEAQYQIPKILKHNMCKTRLEK